jgi:hypothetical protein
MADLRRLARVPSRGGSIAAAALLLATRSAHAAESLERARKDARSEKYRAPAAANLTLAEDLFRGLLGPEEDARRLAGLAGRIGLEIIEVRDGEEDLIAVREPPAARAGRGFYVFRRGPAAPLALQAPHALDDKLTGPLAAKLFRESRARAAAWSTAPRSAAVDGSSETADLARLPESFLASFTRAFADAQPHGIVVQLHGFDGEARRSTASPGWPVIVSGGTRSPSAWLLELAPCLERSLGERVAVFPRDIGELGGTTNAQGKLLRSLGHSGFLHVEMDMEARRKLRDGEDLRRAFTRCLAAAKP